MKRFKFDNVFHFTEADAKSWRALSLLLSILSFYYVCLIFRIKIKPRLWQIFFFRHYSQSKRHGLLFYYISAANKVIFNKGRHLLSRANSEHRKHLHLILLKSSWLWPVRLKMSFIRIYHSPLNIRVQRRIYHFTVHNK